MEAWVKKYLMEGEDALEPHNGNPYAALHRSKSLTEVERLRLMVAKQEVKIARLKKGTGWKELVQTGNTLLAAERLRSSRRTQSKISSRFSIQRLLRIYSGRIPDFKEAAVKLGGILIPGGDAAVELELFDNLYIRFLLWEGDEEFPASSQILFSSNFPAAFSVYDLTEIVEIILGVMKEKGVQK